MNKLTPTPCRKCGGSTKIRWDEGEKSSGMDIRPLRSAGMRQSCLECGFETTVPDLENRDATKEELLKSL